MIDREEANSVNPKECVAMILAGGRGERLGALTRYYSKPAVHFGKKHRIIDFTLSNCLSSGISTVGILSQYFSTDLHAYIDTVISSGQKKNRIFTLPSQSDDNLYKGTADAIYKNISFLDSFNPENVLILAGDHIYRMDYGEMIEFHSQTGADVTVASTPVIPKDASRFGIVNADKFGCVYCFEEKPVKPKSHMASMGIYVFKWRVLRDLLLQDSEKILSRHDFGKDILPEMLKADNLVYTYVFNGYWRDVGTIDSLWDANMDCIGDQSDVAVSATVLGRVEHSVICDSATVGSASEIINSVVMPGAYIGSNVTIRNAIVGTMAMISDGTVIGSENGEGFFVDRSVCSRGISLVAPWLYVPEKMNVQGNSHVYKERLLEWMPDAGTSSELAFNKADGGYIPLYERRTSFA